MTTRRIGRDEFDGMPEEYRELVIRLLLLQAEGELTGSDMYTQQFFPLAPDSYERYVCCLRAAEEVDHYRVYARVLRDLGIDTDYMVRQSVMERDKFPLASVRFQFETWEDRAAFSALAEYNGHFQILNMMESSYQPLADACPGVLKEEAGHALHGWRILRKLSRSEEGFAKAQRAVDTWFPLALDSFGRSDSKRSAKYVEWGIKKHGNEELRQMFLADVVPRLQKLGFEVPDPRANRSFL